MLVFMVLMTGLYGTIYHLVESPTPESPPAIVLEAKPPVPMIEYGMPIPKGK